MEIGVYTFAEMRKGPEGSSDGYQRMKDLMEEIKLAEDLVQQQL
jgi:hypothetical protein